MFWISLAVGMFLGTILYRIMVPVCKRKGCNSEQVVDCENKRVYQKCSRCHREFQYDFQKDLDGLDWIGFQSGENQCSICLGWKPRAWKFCSSSYCELNPKGPMKLEEDL